MQRLRYIIIVILMLCAPVLNAQHLEFMGIPIDGSPFDFKAKLESLGFKAIEGTEDFISIIREYAGEFCGKKCELRFGYNIDTLQVWIVGISTVANDSKDEENAFFEELKNMLNKKYADAYKIVIDNNNEPEKEYTIDIYSSPDKDDSEYLGIISLCTCMTNELNAPHQYFTGITWRDTSNSPTHNKRTHIIEVSD